MTRRPVRWRTTWALAQVTGVLFSSAVWLVVLAASRGAVLAALIGGVLGLALNRSPLVLGAVLGARPAAPADRDAVLRAIVPVASLRGRNQPQVWVGGGRRARGWDVLAMDRRTLVVSGPMVAALRAGEISDLEVSALAAHACGQLPALGPRFVQVVDLFCLPWGIVELIAARAGSRLSRMPLMSLSWRIRPVVFGLGLIDAAVNARWEAFVPLVVVTVLTYTTGPANRAWQRTLAELGDRRVADEGLGPVFTRLVLDPRDPADRRRAQTLMGAGR